MRNLLNSIKIYFFNCENKDLQYAKTTRRRAHNIDEKYFVLINISFSLLSTLFFTVCSSKV